MAVGDGIRSTEWTQATQLTALLLLIWMTSFHPNAAGIKPGEPHLQEKWLTGGKLPILSIV